MGFQRAARRKERSARSISIALGVPFNRDRDRGRRRGGTHRSGCAAGLEIGARALVGEGVAPRSCPDVVVPTGPAGVDVGAGALPEPEFVAMETSADGVDVKTIPSATMSPFAPMALSATAILPLVTVKDPRSA